jgi:hypothetical protein
MISHPLRTGVSRHAMTGLESSGPPVAHGERRAAGESRNASARLEGVEFEASRVSGWVRNASSHDLVALRLVYVPNDGVRDGGTVFYCDLDVRIAPGEDCPFECHVPEGRARAAGGELRILSFVTRAAIRPSAGGPFAQAG